MAYDLQSSVAQSAADKLVKSVGYPFTVFERKSPYEGLALADFEADPEDEAIYRLDEKQLRQLLGEADKVPKTYDRQGNRPMKQEDQLAHETLRGLEEIAANARECLDALHAHTAAKSEDKPAWDGPTEQELKDIIAAAEARPLSYDSLRTTLGDWGITPLVTWIKVQLREAPAFTLGGTVFGLGVKVAADGTGEVWLKHPWLKCVKKWHGICYGWKKITKHTLLLRVTLRGIKVKAKAEAHLSTNGPLVLATGKFTELRLDHKWLDQIPLERIANQALTAKPVTIFDAGKLVATVPLLGSRFTVGSLVIPNVPGEIGVEVTLKQL